MSIRHTVRSLAIGLSVGACLGGPSLAAEPPALPQVTTPGAARVWFIRQFEPSESLARPMIYANGTPVAPSEPSGAFYRDFTPGGYTFTVDGYGQDSNQATSLQLAAGTQTYLEIQSLRSWESDNETFQRDTFYVRIPSAYFLQKYYLPQLTYLGAR